MKRSSSVEGNFHLGLTRANTSFRRPLQLQFLTSKQIQLLIVLDTQLGNSHRQMSRSLPVDSQVRGHRLCLATDQLNVKREAQNASFDLVVLPISSSANIKPQTSTIKLLQTFPAKNGLCFFSSPTVVIGPCPGQMMVSSGNVRIFSRLFCTASR